LLQSSPQKKDVKAHQASQLRCSHLDATVKKQAAKTKVNCLGGRKNGEKYCEPGEEVDCPGSPGVKCGISISVSCCPNPCPGVAPYGNASDFPCPSNPDSVPAGTCEADVKVDDCLDPCAPTPSPTDPVSPTPSPTAPESPTPSPTSWVCHQNDINPPGFKASPNMECNTNATCYGAYVSTCETGATCYAQKEIETCDSLAHCCAGQQIQLCKAGATCWAKSITTCSSGATCIERPSWTIGDDI